MMAFTRDDLENYEKGPQKQVDDKLNPFRGATPARAADAAAVAAVAAGQNVDATPGGSASERAAPESLVDDDAPIVDEDGTLGDQTDSGEGTSDEAAESSTADVELSDETDPNQDLTGEVEEVEASPARPAPKKGSAEERIVELNDYLEGTKIFGKHMQDQLKDALSEIERLKNGGKPATAQTAAVAPPVEKDEPMPDLSDADIAFDNDKYRAKMEKWIDDRADKRAERKLRELTGASEQASRRAQVEAKIQEFAKTHKDYEAVVTKNPVLAANQLAFDAGAAVAQSEHVARLLYDFGKDTALAVRTAKQTPAQQLVTIGKMIAKIEAEATSATPVKNGSKPNAQPGQKKSITQAPPPPRATVAGGRAGERTVVDPNMSMDEFARRHRGGKQSAREQHRKMRGLN
jgi:hypothetical protein